MEGVFQTAARKRTQPNPYPTHVLCGSLGGSLFASSTPTQHSLPISALSGATARPFRRQRRALPLALALALALEPASASALVFEEAPLPTQRTAL